LCKNPHKKRQFATQVCWALGERVKHQYILESE
jgi:hypothetical protein